MKPEYESIIDKKCVQFVAPTSAAASTRTDHSPTSTTDHGFISTADTKLADVDGYSHHAVTSSTSTTAEEELQSTTKTTPDLLTLIMPSSKMDTLRQQSTKHELGTGTTELFSNVFSQIGAIISDDSSENTAPTKQNNAAFTTSESQIFKHSTTIHLDGLQPTDSEISTTKSGLKEEAIPSMSSTMYAQMTEADTHKTGFAIKSASTRATLISFEKFRDYFLTTGQIFAESSMLSRNGHLTSLSWNQEKEENVIAQKSSSAPGTMDAFTDYEENTPFPKQTRATSLKEMLSLQSIDLGNVYSHSVSSTSSDVDEMSATLPQSLFTGGATSPSLISTSKSLREASTRSIGTIESPRAYLISEEDKSSSAIYQSVARPDYVTDGLVKTLPLTQNTLSYPAITANSQYDTAKESTSITKLVSIAEKSTYKQISDESEGNYSVKFDTTNVKPSSQFEGNDIAIAYARTKTNESTSMDRSTTLNSSIATTEFAAGTIINLTPNISKVLGKVGIPLSVNPSTRKLGNAVTTPSTEITRTNFTAKRTRTKTIRTRTSTKNVRSTKNSATISTTASSQTTSALSKQSESACSKSHTTSAMTYSSQLKTEERGKVQTCVSFISHPTSLSQGSSSKQFPSTTRMSVLSLQETLSVDALNRSAETSRHEFSQSKSTVSPPATVEKTGTIEKEISTSTAFIPKTVREDILSTIGEKSAPLITTNHLPGQSTTSSIISTTEETAISATIKGSMSNPIPTYKKSLSLARKLTSLAEFEPSSSSPRSVLEHLSTPSLTQYTNENGHIAIEDHSGKESQKITQKALAVSTPIYETSSTSLFDETLSWLYATPLFWLNSISSTFESATTNYSDSPMSSSISKTLPYPATTRWPYQMSLSDEEQSTTVKGVTKENVSPTTQQATAPQKSTRVSVATAGPEGCKNACPAQYHEGPHYCYRILSQRQSITYRRAMRSCQGEDSYLADEIDFRSQEVIEVLANISGTTAIKTYISEKNSESMKKSKQVRIISLKGTTRFFLNVVAYAGSDKNFVDVYGVCRRTKYCQEVHCRLDNDTVAMNSELIFPAVSNKLLGGETLYVSCAKDNSIVVEVVCNERGMLELQTASNTCGKEGYAEADGDLIDANPKSCSDCDFLGTEACRESDGSFLCVCKTECGLQCGVNGTCVSALDKAYCQCDEGYSGEQCNVERTRLSFYAQNEYKTVLFADVYNRIA
ncbi:unnamed protein product [Cylicocyclus nassatus]|uniref:EGF-like domain-containing protein n=1 Tax=Cylicocyclus nassatus TaxID=53992 RepID=A0AA36GZ53_CYLNA|nr:unnamed protein product [Cylicocyclus nassatus]